MNLIGNRLWRGAATVFTSGLAVMILELVAGRLVAPYFGQSTRTWAALTGVTLAGVTLGNALGGWLSAKTKLPARVARCALALGGVLASILPFALPSVFALVSGFKSVEAQIAAFTLVAWLPLMLILGCITPSVAALCVRTESNGRDLGLLYFFSMIGSAFGSTLGGLLLPFVLPADTLYLVFGAILLLAMGWLWGEKGESTVSEPRALPTEAIAGDGKLVILLFTLSIFVVGWFGMGIELAGARLVTPILGGNHIVWSLIFITFIGAMGAGGYFGGWLSDRLPRLETVVYSLLALSVVAFVTVSLVTMRLPEALCGAGPVLRMLTFTVFAFSPLAFALGTVSTVLLKFATGRALARGNRAVVGFMYAISSAGCVCGTFITGFVCVGRINSTDICLGLTALVVLVAFALAVFAEKNGRKSPHLFWPTAAFAALAALFLGGKFLCGGRAWSDGFVSVQLPTEVRYDDGWKMLSTVESPYNVVTVSALAKDEKMRTVWLDRIPHTSVSLRDRNDLTASYTRLIDVVVRELVARQGKDAEPSLFMIGGGGYALPRKWTQGKVPWRRLVVAEIDRAVVDSARTYLDANPVRTNGVEYAVDDGRRVADRLWEEGERGSFDIAVGDTISDSAIPYHLVTREFNDRVKRLLKPDGAYLLHVLDTPDRPYLLASLLKTLSASYAHLGVMFYQGVTDVRHSMVVVATDDPTKATMDAYARRLVETYPEACPLVYGERETAELAGRAEALLLTDRFCPMERFVWDVVARSTDKRVERDAAVVKALVREGRQEEAFARLKDSLTAVPEFGETIVALTDYIAEYPDDERALKLLESQAARKSAQHVAKAAYASVLARGGESERAEKILRSLRDRFPQMHDLTQGWLMVASACGKGEAAARWLEENRSRFADGEYMKLKEAVGARP